MHRPPFQRVGDDAMKLIAITTALVAAGCVPAGLPDGADGGTPTTGLYRLTQTTTGNCLPAELDGTSFGYVDGDKPPALLISVTPEMFGTPAAGVPGYGTSLEALEVPNGQSLAHDYDLCNANMSQVFTVEEQAADHLRVRRDDTLSAVAGGDPACLPTSSLPSADCTQSTEIEYQLMQPCPQSCIQPNPPTDLTQPLTFHCSC
jgi:hypothetical protein